MSSVGRINKLTFRLVTELSLVFTRNLRSDLISGRRIDKKAAAAAEPAA
jgi:hypothetical protein